MSFHQNKSLFSLHKLDPLSLSSAQPPNDSSNDQQSLSETKPKVTLEERVSRGEAQKGPTVPSNQEQQQGGSSSTGVRQVYPELSAAQQEEQLKQAKLQAAPPVKDEKQQVADDTATANDISVATKHEGTKQTKDISRDDEEKIVASILKQLEPIVEKRVAAELRRLQSGGTDEDEDEDFGPMPFVLGGGFPFFAAPRGGPSSAQGSKEQQTGPGQEQLQQGNGPTVSQTI